MEAIEALGCCETEGNRVVLPPLERKLYLEVAEALKALGGPWNKKAKAHVFEGDPRDAIEQVVLTGGFTDKKQEFGFFESPPEVVAELLEWAAVITDHTVLEPSAGRGAIVRPIIAKAKHVTAIELQKQTFEQLQGGVQSWVGAHDMADAYRSGVHLIEGDFLAIAADGERPLGPFDRIVMNPPFRHELYAEHIIAAAQLLAPRGRLVSVAPISVNYRTTRKTMALREMIAMSGRIVPLPDDAFKVSGTDVRTCIVVVNG